MMPSTVGVPAVALSIRSFSRSPAAAWNEIAGVLSSDGVFPAVPPSCIGQRSCIVSDPEYTVRFTSAVPVARARMMIDAGHGRYSYCHPLSGLNPSWFAVMAWLQFSWGIFLILLVAVTTLFTLPTGFAEGAFFLVAFGAAVNFQRRLFFRKYMRP